MNLLVMFRHVAFIFTIIFLESTFAETSEWRQKHSNLMNENSFDDAVALLIEDIVSNPIEEARVNAAFHLSSYYTDNGAEGYKHIPVLEDNVKMLFLVLFPEKIEGSPYRFVVNVLGSRYTGSSFSPCYMKRDNYELIIKKLHESAVFFKSIRQTDKWYQEWDYAFNELNLAISNVESCNQINNK
jgi:hypothetical protein